MSKYLNEIEKNLFNALSYINILLGNLNKKPQLYADNILLMANEEDDDNVNNINQISNEPNKNKGKRKAIEVDSDSDQEALPTKKLDKGKGKAIEVENDSTENLSDSGLNSLELDKLKELELKHGLLPNTSNPDRGEKLRGVIQEIEVHLMSLTTPNNPTSEQQKEIDSYNKIYDHAQKEEIKLNIAIAEEQDAERYSLENKSSSSSSDSSDSPDSPDSDEWWGRIDLFSIGKVAKEAADARRIERDIKRAQKADAKAARAEEKAARAEPVVYDSELEDRLDKKYKLLTEGFTIDPVGKLLPPIPVFDSKLNDWKNPLDDKDKETREKLIKDCAELNSLAGFGSDNSSNSKEDSSSDNSSNSKGDSSGSNNAGSSGGVSSSGEGGASPSGGYASSSGGGVSKSIQSPIDFILEKMECEMPFYPFDDPD